MMITNRLSSSSSTATTTIAVIGAGWWSQGWHLPHLSRNSNIKIVVVDQSQNPTSNLNPNLESLSSLAKRYDDAPYFHSTQEMLQDPIIGPTLDGAIIATPHASHYSIGELLLKEGMKRQQEVNGNSDDYRPIHILMEKPMTTDVHEGKKLHDLVTTYKQELKGKGSFMINHSANYRNQTQKAKDIVSSGQIGHVRHITAFFASPLSWIFEDPNNNGWNEAFGNMLGNGFCWGQSSHLLAWIYHVCPSTLEPIKVFCAMNHSNITGADVSHGATIICKDNQRTDNNQNDDNDDVIMSMSGTSLLPGNAHSDPPIGKRIRIKIFGSKGAIIYTGDDRDDTSGRLELRLADNDGQVEHPCGDNVGFDFENLDQDGEGPESLQNFLDACLTYNSSPRDKKGTYATTYEKEDGDSYYVGADSLVGLKTVQTLDAMYRSDVSRQAEDVLYKS